MIGLAINSSKSIIQTFKPTACQLFKNLNEQSRSFKTVQYWNYVRQIVNNTSYMSFNINYNVGGSLMKTKLWGNSLSDVVGIVRAREVGQQGRPRHRPFVTRSTA